MDFSHYYVINIGFSKEDTDDKKEEKPFKIFESNIRLKMVAGLSSKFNLTYNQLRALQL